MAPASRSPDDVLKGCSRYLDLAATDPHRITYAYLPGRRSASAVMTAEALLSRQLLGWPRKFPPLVKGASQIARRPGDLERSGTSTTGITRPSSCTT